MILNLVWARLGLCVGLTGWLLTGHLSAVSAQSDPAGFDTIINLPPSAIGEDGSIGSDTQLNVADLGAIGFRFEAGDENGDSTNVEVNVSGGSIGNFFDANNGSTVNISGGVIGTGFRAMPGSTVEISGGIIGERFAAEVGSSVTLIGAEFLVNGVAPVDPSAVTLSGTDVLEGTFQDGTTFIFSPQGSFFESEIINDVVLQTVPLSAIDLTPITISTPSDVAPIGLRAGQTLTLEGTGELGSNPPTSPREDRVGNFIAIDATLNIDGGSVLSGLEVLRTSVNITGGSANGINAFAGSQFNISGGEAGSLIDAFDGSVVNMSGGLVRNSLDAHAGSTANISGGVLGSLSARSGSTVNISGGDTGIQFSAREGSTVFINGGKLSDRFEAQSGSDVTLVGGEFLVNGAAPLDPASVTLTEAEALSGTLEDGSQFIFSPAEDDLINDVTLLPGTVPPIDLTPILVADVEDVAPEGLRAGQSLTLQGTGTLPENFIAAGATIAIEGGTVERRWDIANSTIDVTGGEIASGDLFGSTLNIEDGVVWSVNALAGSTVNQSGGTIGFTRLGANSVFNLTGGTLGGGSGSLIGSFSILADLGSTLNLFPSEASIDGVALDLVPGETLVIEQRNVVLSGILADGSEFSFLLQPFPFIPAIGGDAFAPGSTITVTMVAADPEIILGDVNQDGDVNFQDISPFIAALASASPFIPEADCNQDGAVNFLDITSFIAILSGE